MKMIKLIVFLLFILPVNFYGQDSKKEYDSIMSLSITDKKKIIIVEDFFNEKKRVKLEELPQIYYEYSKWNWRKGRRDRAINYAKKVCGEHTESLKVSINLRKKNLFNLGIFYRGLNTNKSLEYFDKLINISNAYESRLGNVYRVRGDIYDELGDFQKALENYENSERILKYNNNKSSLLVTYVNIIGTYANLNDEMYIDSFFKVINKINQLKKRITIPKKTRINLYVNIAKVYNTTSNFIPAINKYQKALFLAEKEKDSTNIFKVLIGLGVVNKRKGEYIKADSYFKKSKKYILNNKLYLSTFYNNIADLFLEKKEYEKALNNYNKAINSLLISNNTTTFKELPQVENISISPYKRDILDYLIDKANGWYKYYQTSLDKDHLLEAEKTISLADKIIDLLYYESNEELSKLFWRKKGAELYLRAVTINYLLENPERAMYYMEKNKGIFLIEMSNTYKGKQLAKIPNNIIDRENKFLESIKNIQTVLLSDIFTDKEKDSVKSKLFTQKNQFEKFIDSLEIAFPKYYKLKKSLEIQTVSSIQKSISENQIIVTYIIGREVGYALLISKQAIEFQKLNNIARLNNEIHEFKENISKPFITKTVEKQFQKNANIILAKLFPFKDFKKLVKDKELIIIADGELQYIPFEALCVTTKKELEDSYLLRLCDVYYKYSLSIEKQISFYKNNGKNNYVSFIPTTFKDKKLETLSHNALEIESISPYFKQIYKNKKATKKQFLDSYDKNSIIHISTHGGVENGIPWLAFNDDKLQLNELFTLKNQKELVVLSACKSSVGNHKKGEGLFNLTRGFISTGAKSVLSTLWNINEKSSSEIITVFYKNMKQGMRKSEALRNAKLIYIKKHKNTSEASPYYWSSFVLTGENNIVNPKNTFTEVIVLGVLFVFVLFVFLFFRKK